jgi:hypothetical protein
MVVVADGLILLPALGLADELIVITADVGVDVFSDNTTLVAVLPPTTPPQPPRTAHSPVRKNTGRRAALSATTSTPSITAQTIE